MARTESRAFDAYFDPVWASSANPGPPQPHFDAKTQVAAGRYKYCQRPLVAHLDPVQSTVLLAPSAAPKEEDVIGEGRVKDAGTQSVYRESEAQTDPYSPEYVVPKGTDPEVLLLEGLKYGQGLPAGAREVEKNRGREQQLHQAVQRHQRRESLSLHTVFGQHFRNFVPFTGVAAPGLFVRVAGVKHVQWFSFWADVGMVAAVIHVRQYLPKSEKQPVSG